MLGPVLVGERIRLAPIGPEQLEAFCRWFADMEVIRYLTNFSPPSLKQEEEWFDNMVRNERIIYWGIFVDEAFVGGTSIAGINWQHRHGTGGTIIGDTSYWRRGVGSEAMRLRTDYAFHELGFEKMKSEAFAENWGSRRSLELAGYRAVGTEQREIYRDGRWHDIVLYEILREEWAALEVYQRLRKPAASAP